SSTLVGIENLKQQMPKGKQFTVRLHFAELEGLAPGQRIFGVGVCWKTSILRTKLADRSVVL
ncbi:malectin, partial [bacterium]|nr:malectin [bacterium]